MQSYLVAFCNSIVFRAANECTLKALWQKINTLYTSTTPHQQLH